MKTFFGTTFTCEARKFISVFFLLGFFCTDVETRWVETFFPFTHPSWELEVNYNGEWLEVLGCGIMEQSILQNGKKLPLTF